MSYKKILLPYDGSSKSEQAFEHALEIAKLSKGSIIILNVIQSIPLPSTRLTFYSKIINERVSAKEYIKELYEEIKKEIIKSLESKKKECVSAGIDVDIKVLVGNVIETILKVAREEKVDLIIIGSSGLSGLSKIRALGSVSRGVAEKSTCPVLLIH